MHPRVPRGRSSSPPFMSQVNVSVDTDSSIPVLQTIYRAIQHRITEYSSPIHVTPDIIYATGTQLIVYKLSLSPQDNIIA